MKKVRGWTRPVACVFAQAFVQKNPRVINTGANCRRKTARRHDGRRWASAGPAGRLHARPAARHAQRLLSAAQVGRPPSPRRLDSPLPSPFSADPMLRVDRPQNALAIDVEVPRPPSPPGGCSWRMVVCDRAFITGAMGGAMGGAILPRVYKRQPANFAR